MWRESLRKGRAGEASWEFGTKGMRSRDKSLGWEGFHRGEAVQWQKCGKKWDFSVLVEPLCLALAKIPLFFTFSF